ncbi:MAG TPA: TetR/AcrR family transcriptional regulator [Sphingobium sp.]|uniref:TetR/AcrR family transcriptional regulator n=1 Tax=Sphingobium sp. TaxID=1912891 RepID=UPI002ED47657
MPPSPRNRSDPDRRRADILEHATGLIGERGYYGFTVQELARRCGLSNPGLLYYFPSKHDLLIGVLDALQADETAAMTPIVEAALQKSSDAAEDRASVLNVLRMIVARAVERPLSGRLLAALQTESLDAGHPAHSWWRARETVLLNLFVKLVDGHVINPAASARQLLAMMDGLCLHWLRADQGFDVVSIWEDALIRLLPELHKADAG